MRKPTSETRSTAPTAEEALRWVDSQPGLREHIDRLVAEAPPFSEEQKRKLRDLLCTPPAPKAEDDDR